MEVVELAALVVHQEQEKMVVQAEVVELIVMVMDTLILVVQETLQAHLQVKVMMVVIMVVMEQINFHQVVVVVQELLVKMLQLIMKLVMVVLVQLLQSQVHL